MKSTDALWRQFDKVFAEADKLWAEADRLMQETPEHTFSENSHNVRFITKTFVDRFELAWYFLHMAAKVLCTGKAQLRFKRAKSHVQNN